MVKIRVGFKVSYTDADGNEHHEWRQSVEEANNYGKYLYHKGCRFIRVSATPRTIPQKERAK